MLKYTPEQRENAFWSRVDKSGGDDACWVWTGVKYHNGYGQFSERHAHAVRAHRWSYTQYVGEIPDGLYVCHTCDNRACVNPKHLWLGTPHDNSKDAFHKRHTAKNTIPRMAKRSKNYNNKLSASEVSEIREKYASGDFTQQYLSEYYCVSDANISMIINRKTWRHIP